ncbi:MAG: hypothetical protein LUD02_10960 [Tannerellaceae bacterium]|nr:hypothetical protein [Tannerellaceae bacterium]
MSIVIKKSIPDEVNSKWFEAINTSIHTTSPVLLVYSFRRSEKELCLSEERAEPVSKSSDISSYYSRIKTGQEVSGQLTSEKTTVFITEWSVLEQSELQEILKSGISDDFVVDWF